MNALLRTSVANSDWATMRVFRMSSPSQESGSSRYSALSCQLLISSELPVSVIRSSYSGLGDPDEDVLQRRARDLEVIDRRTRGEAREKRLRIPVRAAPPAAGRSR